MWKFSSVQPTQSRALNNGSEENFLAECVTFRKSIAINWETRRVPFFGGKKEKKKVKQRNFHTIKIKQFQVILTFLSPAPKRLSIPIQNFVSVPSSWLSLCRSSTTTNNFHLIGPQKLLYMFGSPTPQHTTHISSMSRTISSRTKRKCVANSKRLA